ncbi:MAG: glucosaminidase domain-containing protein [Hyphomicrobiaceae bacterium]
MTVGAVLAVAGTLSSPVRADDARVRLNVTADNRVPACATPGRLMAYLRARNPALDPRFSNVAVHYARHGRASGLRWDLAFFQMIVETASLSFRRPDGRPSSVRSWQNNFAGLGATGRGVPGESFASVETGIIAHLQHLSIYAGRKIETPLAERTRKVQSWGILATWRGRLAHPVTFVDVARKWAPSDRTYARSISSVARRFHEGFCRMADPEPEMTVAAARPTARAAHAARPKPPAGTFERIKKALVDPPQATDTPPVGLGRPAPPVARPRQAAPVQRRTVKVVALPPPPVAAPSPALPKAPPPSPDDALRTLVSGRTVLLDTPIGSVIPITFAEDGAVQGRAGSLSSYLGAAKDDGRWWVEKGRLCQKWKVWFEGQANCLKLRQIGEVVHWTRDDGRSGTARFARQ